MEKSPRQLVLFFVLLLSNAIAGGCFPSTGEQGNVTMSWPFEHHPKLFRPNDKSASGQNNNLIYVTRRIWLPKGGQKIYGVEATLDVYGLSVQPGQVSVAALWIVNKGDGQPSSLSGVQVGWGIKPRLYKDSHTHFYTSWTSFSKGCDNMFCPGFRKTSSSIAPGDVINPVSVITGRKQFITLRLFKDKSSGDWHVHYGFNGHPQPVGYFPKSLIPGMIDKPVEISFGGFVSHQQRQPSPPMGSGYFPRSGNAASFSNLRLIDADGKAYPVNNNLEFDVDDRNCYPITNIDSSRFLYGGSGCA